ncbi:MAG TPA: SURF1 family protein [Burkholderiaceae bacterium]|nr:SURF1 family protein [Burkholderiaceae bacterium]
MTRARPRSTLFLGVLAAAGAALFALFIALGWWQVERRAWKLALIERVQQRVNAPAQAAPTIAQWPSVTAANDEYRHVRIRGEWLNERNTWVQATTELGSGYWLLAPLRTEDGGTVLINRGFVPSIQRGASTAASGPVDVTGLLRISEPGGRFPRRNDPATDRWYSRELPAIAAARGLGTVAPFFVDADRVADAAPGEPVGGLTVIAFHNNHLVYALTWFGLAAMVLGAGVLVARSERRTRLTEMNRRPDAHPD